MKKSIYLIILAVITIAAIIFGTNYRFKKFDSDFKDIKDEIKSFIEDGDINFSFNSDDDDDDFNFSYDINSEKSNITVRGQEFSKIKMDVKVSSVTIEEGDDYSFRADFNRPSLKPEYTITNGELYVTQKSVHKSGNNNCHIVITVPRFTQLEKLDVTVNVGELNIRNLSFYEGNITNNVGEIDVKNVTFDNLDVVNNVGEIDIYPTEDFEEYSLDLETNIGEVHVDGNNHKKQYSSKGTTDKYIRAKTNVGEISIR